MADRTKRLILAAKAMLFASRSRAAITAVVTLAGLMVALVISSSGQQEPPSYQYSQAVIAPFEVRLSLVGRIEPDDAIEIVAPFEGEIQTLNFDYGALVQKGDLLFEMNAALLRQQVGAARATELKAKQTLLDVKHWSQSVEVSQVARRRMTIERDLKTAKQRLSESEELFGRGLISRHEHESAGQALADLEIALAAAVEEEEKVLSRGGSIYVQAADADYQSAYLKRSELEAQLNASRQIAPIAGIILKPAIEQGSRDPVSVHSGGRVASGQLLALLAPADRRSVVVRLNEIDALSIKPGLRAFVSGRGFPGTQLEGHVQWLSRQGEGDSSGNRTIFMSRIRLDPLLPDLTDQVRIGMTANVDIIAYHKAAALMIPVAALMKPGPDSQVLVQRQGRLVPTSVRVGRATANNVEVLGGLKAGDVVAWPQG